MWRVIPGNLARALKFRGTCGISDPYDETVPRATCFSLTPVDRSETVGRAQISESIGVVDRRPAVVFLHLRATPPSGILEMRPDESRVSGGAPKKDCTCAGRFKRL